MFIFRWSHSWLKTILSRGLLRKGRLEMRWACNLPRPALSRLGFLRRDFTIAVLKASGKMSNCNVSWERHSYWVVTMDVSLLHGYLTISYHFCISLSKSHHSAQLTSTYWVFWSVLLWMTRQREQKSQIIIFRASVAEV